ncbi:hypothetical protein H257_16372 [Aphanomyces astaci]|uniref:Uncharacterized protein n=1 Tax=Aphanomyces astaci TaxID=112090 RepID=W4FKW8_APHAT|nr:hypothetical protein H257_16372 [Aphanomyces astaci]ETV67526.1 hypothetical protein H257_16372 [Aphanomyces astaci]|eukprot:XP_009843085.1 hypothetical protein H257_16372 [Aphanomyces astaci]
MLSRSLSTLSPNNSSPCDSPTQPHSPTASKQCSNNSPIKPSFPPHQSTSNNAAARSNFEMTSFKDAPPPLPSANRTLRSRHFSFNEYPHVSPPKLPSSSSSFYAVPPSRYYYSSEGSAVAKKQSPPGPDKLERTVYQT